jgi:hypothetical protein
MFNLKFGVHVYFLAVVFLLLYYNVGAFQGMSDFLAPILYVMEDESESFWCFASLMERLGANFNRDQNGMHAQLLALSKVYNIFICQVLSEQLVSRIMLLLFHSLMLRGRFQKLLCYVLD